MKQYVTSLQSLFIITVCIFWGFPFFKDMLPVDQVQELSKGFLYLVNPAFCISASYLYLQEKNFTWYLPFGIMLIFLPLPFLFYDGVMITLVPIYGICILISEIMIIIKRRLSKS